jgi:hypothetical protein
LPAAAKGAASVAQEFPVVIGHSRSEVSQARPGAPLAQAVDLPANGDDHGASAPVGQAPLGAIDQAEREGSEGFVFGDAAGALTFGADFKGAFEGGFAVEAADGFAFAPFTPGLSGNPSPPDSASDAGISAPTSSPVPPRLLWGPRRGMGARARS